MTTGDVDPLITELRSVVGLDAVDANRSAFTAFAVCDGWSKARIGRYLGISRARVGQKVDKLEHYAHSFEVPVLKGILDRWPDKSDKDKDERLVLFHADDWQDPEFARALINRVVSSN